MKTSALGIAAFCVFVYSASTSDTVRIGVYDLPNYHSFDNTGKVVGYEADLVSRLSRYTNWEIKYVKINSWEEGLNKILSGELDLLSPAKISAERFKTFDYSTNPIGKVCTAISTTESSPISFDDYNAFAKARIGTEKETVHEESLILFAEAHSFKPNIVEYKNWNDLKEALLTGKVDAIVHNFMHGDSTLKTVAKFNCASYYFIMKKGREKLKASLSSAIDEVDRIDPGYQTRLEAVYFPKFTQEYLTKEEQDYIDRKKILTVGFPVDQEPFSYRDDKTKEIKGISVEIFKRIEKKSGLHFKYTTFPDITKFHSLSSMKIDVVAGLNRKEILIFPKEYKISQPYISSQNVLVSKKDLVLPKDSRYRVTMSKELYDNMDSNKRAIWIISFAPSIEAALDSVRLGKTDMAFISEFAASNMLHRWKFEDMALIPQTGSIDNLRAAVISKSDPLLYSILNKSIKNLNEEDRNIAIRSYIFSSAYASTAQDIWSKFGIPAIVIFLVLIAIFVVIAILYTMHIKYMELLRQKNIELEQASESKSKFLSLMSHEIRTPMNTILGLSEIIYKDDTTNAVTKKRLGLINTAGKYLLGLINAIIDKSKIERGIIDLKNEFFSMNEALDEMLTNIHIIAETKHVSIVSESDDYTQIYLKLDKTRYEQIFLTLISDAIQFAKEGSNIQFDIHLLPSSEGSTKIKYTIKICKLNTDLDKFQQIYEQPLTLDSTLNDSPGLGLTVVKGMIEKMNGSINLQSDEQSSISFIIILESKSTTDKNEINATTEETNPADKLKGKCVLIVEDNTINREIAKLILMSAEIIVEEAHNGKEAVDLFRENPVGHYNAILMDLRMPIMDGFEATEAIRNSKRAEAKTIPIIAMTADAFTDDMEKTSAAGMNAHLSKPVESKTLLKTLAEFVT
ncbi:MAG: transporter substrate-binding domain-containing protein [Fibrobacteraceae bacterium]